MKFEIKNKFSGKVQLTIEGKTFKLALESAIKLEADLQGANLQEADLQEADLQGANLRWANLQGANLQEADLQEADLRWANLRWADLQGANLQEADLQGANLRWANLRGANLQEADLQEADLQEADLQEADLDFSCWPLACKSFKVKVDDRFVAQLFAHWARLDISNCSAMVRYVHRVSCSLFNGYMKNLFCEYRSDVEKIR